MIPYTKPHLGIADQIALLQSRGMVVTDQVRAISALERIGYYRLSGYWYPMRQSRLILDPATAKPKAEVLDDFRSGTTFAHAVDLYVFDKRLRLLFLDAIERVEVGLRVDIALLLGGRDSWAHRNPAQLHGNFARRVDPRTGRTPHNDWLDRLDELAARSKEDYVEHFRTKYSDPLPIWVAIELWDFGLLSRFLSGMTHADQTMVAGRYGVPRPELLTSWVRAINHVRNICAHHNRLWNRSPADQPKPPRLGEIALLDHLVGDQTALKRIYAVAAAIQLLLRTINPTTSWADRLKHHMASFPVAPGTVVGQSGFPPGWDQLPLWR